jgi:hypothetical protein
MGIFNDFNKKEKPVFTGIARGIGGFAYGAGAAGGGGGPTSYGPPQGLVASGGIISEYEDGASVYKAHIFTAPGTFTISSTGSYGSTVEYLVVAGGGGAGTGGGGGGGAGGMITGTAPITTGNFAVSVGDG